MRGDTTDQREPLDGGRAGGAVDYTRLPQGTALADTVSTQESTSAPDPTMGRDTETEFLLRHAAG